jgi:hypothetical protein
VEHRGRFNTTEFRIVFGTAALNSPRVDTSRSLEDGLVRLVLDDLIVGPRKVILVSRERRLLINHLTEADIKWLSANWKKSIDVAATTPTLRRLLDKLVGEGIATNLVGVRSRRTALRISSRTTDLMSRPFQVFTYPLVLIALVAATILGLAYGFLKPYPLISVDALLLHISLQFVVISLLTTIGLSFLHELGHAAASVRLTGMTGGIRMRSLHGMIALAVDVTPVRLATKWGKASIASAGITIDLLTCWLLLSLIDEPAVRFGASLALVSATLNLIPFPRTDGFWILNDLRKSPLSAALRPGKTTCGADIFYGWTLLAATLSASSWMIYFAAQVIVHLSSVDRSLNLREVMVIFFFAYIICASITFCVSNLKYISRLND